LRPMVKGKPPVQFGRSSLLVSFFTGYLIWVCTE
jgi:hypothetical protein